ncbi:hypothetical protein KQX54_020616 [Cotesia glomerata]|uniref:Uncharacterized protein n=1 Tax=Cotesia glomerata TaxID=32391 RepID=A0AAV7I3C7_COTGL|nr:hypothetical protein KQX54_020616 [Cotesia glomerata]
MENRRKGGHTRFDPRTIDWYRPSGTDPAQRSDMFDRSISSPVPVHSGKDYQLATSQATSTLTSTEDYRLLVSGPALLLWRPRCMYMYEVRAESLWWGLSLAHVRQPWASRALSWSLGSAHEPRAGDSGVSGR